MTKACSWHCLSARDFLHIVLLMTFPACFSFVSEYLLCLLRRRKTCNSVVFVLVSPENLSCTGFVNYYQNYHDCKHWSWSQDRQHMVWYFVPFSKGDLLYWLVLGRDDIVEDDRRQVILETCWPINGWFLLVLCRFCLEVDKTHTKIQLVSKILHANNKDVASTVVICSS